MNTVQTVTIKIKDQEIILTLEELQKLTDDLIALQYNRITYDL